MVTLGRPARYALSTDSSVPIAYPVAIWSTTKAMNGGRVAV